MRLGRQRQCATSRFLRTSAILPSLFLAVLISAPASESLARALVGAAQSNAYPRYLVGRFAWLNGDLSGASTAMLMAAAGDSETPEISERAFMVAVLNGDFNRAVRLPRAGWDDPFLESIGDQVDAIEAIKTRKASRALTSLNRLLERDPQNRLGRMLRPYVLAMNSRWDEALDDRSFTTNDTVLRFLMLADRAKLLEIKGNFVEAEEVWKQIYRPGPSGSVFGPDYAAFLERRGRKDDARALYSEIGRNDPSFQLRENLTRLDNAGYAAPKAPTLTGSVAEGLYMLATLNYGEQDIEQALAHVQMARYIDVGTGREALFLGQLFTEIDNPSAARSVWLSIPEESTFFHRSRLQVIDNLRDNDRLDEALALTRDLAVSYPSNLGYMTEEAAILHTLGRDEEALSLISRREAGLGTDDFNWQTWFLYAVINASLDRWDAAEVAIVQAQEDNPRRPEVLNFLGYSLIDRGLKIDEGMDLVRHALTLSPESGEILDSLGWGYYRKGDYESAVQYIEQAVQKVPADTEVLTHLGDVYRALGRVYEARYQWQRVLTLDPSDKVREAANARLRETQAPEIGS